MSVLASRAPTIAIRSGFPLSRIASSRQVRPPSVERSTSPGGSVSCLATMMVCGAAADQSTDPKSQLRPLSVKLCHFLPSVVNPARPSSEKLAIRWGSFWSTLVAQPVSSRPETVPPSMRCHVAPRSAMRHRPPPTTLTTTEPVTRSATTPEQPPGHASFSPWLLSFSIKGVEISVQVSTAGAPATGSSTPPSSAKITADLRAARLGSTFVLAVDVSRVQVLIALAP